MGRLTGERRAVAAAVMVFYAFLFLILALAPPPGWGACFSGLAGVYGLGFFALVAGYFWARWFAIGIGMSGLISGLISMWQVGLEPTILFYGGTHGLVSIILWGNGMAGSFDGREEWRKRFHLDENATNRLGKAIIRAGVSLPYIVMYALAPREGAGAILTAVAATGLGVAGIWALIRMRSWGLFAMTASAVALIASVAFSSPFATMRLSGSLYALDLFALGLGGAMLLIAAVAPLAGPAARYLADRG